MEKNRGRVVGLDVHPDSFAGAVMEGTDPAGARVLSSATRVQLERLEQWALRHTSKEDTLVLEASGNAFAVAERLRAIGRKRRSWTVIVPARWARCIAPMIEWMR